MTIVSGPNTYTSVTGGNEPIVPSVPGEYTVFIDLISQHQGIHSFEYDIEVTTP